MRIGMAGIAALYWPVTIANGLAARRDARLVSFATLGVSPSEVKQHLGMTPDEYAAKYGATQYAELDDMMRCEELDAVAVCTRHTQHAKWVERLAPYGKDIFVAKTYTTTMADADRIVAAGRKHHVHVAVAPSARFLPWFVAARQAVDAGRIGTPFSLRICHHHGTIDAFHRKDFYREEKEGGPELSLGWYLVDLVLYLLQQPAVRVSAEYGNYTTPGSPFMDMGKLTMRLKGGAMASCDMYFCSRFAFPTWEMELVGAKGAILVRQPAGQTSTSVALTTAKGQQELTPPQRTPHWELFWVDELKQRCAPSLDAAYAREVTRVCLAARESAKRNRAVSL
jgi:predicted dehydrogenase